MLLGDNFYTKLNKLTIWRQSLFALVLATRQYPNFVLWTELKENPNAAKAYLQALHTCWLYFADRFNHIDLLQASDELDPYISTEQDDHSDGYAFASDCGALMCAALESVPLGIAYGFDASNASLASVIRLCESKYPESLPNLTSETDSEKQMAQEEEALLELAEISHELEFQVELLQKVSQPRNLQYVRELLSLALQEHMSNIGLENPLTTEDFPEIFDQRLDEQEKLSAQNALQAQNKQNADTAATTTTDTSFTSTPAPHGVHTAHNGQRSHRGKGTRSINKNHKKPNQAKKNRPH